VIRRLHHQVHTSLTSRDGPTVTRGYHENHCARSCHAVKDDRVYLQHIRDALEDIADYANAGLTRSLPNGGRRPPRFASST
jgi:hypothetical protein